MKKLKTLQEHIKLTEGVVSVNSKKFEGDLIGAMRHITDGGRKRFSKHGVGPSGNIAANIQWDPDKDKINPDHEDYDKKVHDTYKLVSGIAERMSKKGINIKKSRTGPAQGTTGLSKVYKDFGASSGEPKTDIIFGKYYVSVKNEDGAQLMTGQSNETAAVIQSCVLNSSRVGSKAKSMAKQVATTVQTAMDKDFFVKQLGLQNRPKEVSLKTDYIASLPKDERAALEAKAKKQRTQIFKLVDMKDLPKKAQQEYADQKKRVAKNKDYLNKILGFKPTKPSEETLAPMLAMSEALGIDAQVTKNMTAFFKDKEVYRAIIHEAATGANKFTNKEAVATHMLAWGKDPDKPQYHFATADDFVDVLAASGKIKFDVTVRGTGTGKYLDKHIKSGMSDEDLTSVYYNATRGGAFRLRLSKIFKMYSDLKESDAWIPLDDSDNQFLQESWNEYETDMTRFLLENLEETEEMLLREDILDTLGKGYSKIKQGIKSMLGKLKGFFMAMSRFYMQWVKNVGMFIQAWGMNLPAVPKNMTYYWKPSLS